MLAVERGEADGVLCQRASIRPDMLASGAVVPVLQFYDVEPGVPLLLDLVSHAQEKALLELLMAPQQLGLAVIAPPGVPAELTPRAARRLSEDGGDQRISGGGDQARLRRRRAEHGRGDH